MAQNLKLYGEMLRNKQEEKEELKEEIRKVKLAIKNGRKMALEALKGE